MSYLAIARKYRPATFADIVGQEHVVRTLQNAITTGRIHHAYLFCGARGVGKTTAARALAKALNCENGGPTATPCGACTSCTEIAAGSSPDLIEIDGASNNSVDDVRELRETVGYAPTRGRYKVYLVDEVHMLSKAAFNALLKTLEEPPPHVVFIFATTEPNRILDTILSRVQRFDFKRIPAQAVADRLGLIAQAEGVELSPAALRTIARAGEGSMRDAQSLLDKVIGSASGKAPQTDAQVADSLGLVDRALLLRFLEGMVRGEPHVCIETIAQVYDYGYELSEFTGDLLELVRNATFVALSERSRRFVDVSGDEIARLEEIVKGVPAETLTRLFNALLDTHDQVSRAARPRIVLEMAVARLATVRPVEPVSALVAKLEDLERRLRPMSGAKSGRAPAPRAVRAPPPALGPPVVDPEPPSGARASPKPSPERSEAGLRPRDPSPRPAAAPKPGPPPKPAPKPAQKPAAKRAPEAPAGDEPPPPDDWMLQGGGDEPAGDRPTRSNDPAVRWAEIRPKLAALGPAAARLATAEVGLRGDVLVIRVPAGRALAEARRARGTPEVEGLLRSAFPKLRTFEVAPAAGTGTPADHERALRAQLLDNPELARIVARLGAEIESVTSLEPAAGAGDGKDD